MFLASPGGLFLKRPQLLAAGRFASLSPLESALDFVVDGLADLAAPLGEALRQTATLFVGTFQFLAQSLSFGFDFGVAAAGTRLLGFEFLLERLPTFAFFRKRRL